MFAFESFIVRFDLSDTLDVCVRVCVSFSVLFEQLDRRTAGMSNRQAAVVVVVVVVVVLC
jgi:hypothetical protein